ncbi:MAG: hypothetical protein OEU86_01170 [Gammaproteobacteria bacterium]|nr:hypothetical protein [Gammaproteobacteria bacterium]
MSSEPSDIQNYAEWTGWNREFLRLVTEFGHHDGQSVFGLMPEVIDQLKLLTCRQRDQLAATPGLLVCFAAPVDHQPMKIADAPAAPAMTNTQWRHAAGVFVSALLTYLWKTDCRTVRDAQDLTGQSFFSKMYQPEAQNNFLPVLDVTERAVGQLRARFHDHPTFWADLIHGIHMDNAEFCTLSQLTYIPLAVAEESAESIRAS